MIAAPLHVLMLKSYLLKISIMSYTERYRELATLKVVGFKNRKLKGLLIGQNMWITVAGILLGIAAGGRYE